MSGVRLGGNRTFPDGPKASTERPQVENCAAGFPRDRARFSLDTRETADIITWVPREKKLADYSVNYSQVERESGRNFCAGLNNAKAFRD